MSRTFSPELIEALRKFDELCPMKCRVVETQAELDAAVSEMKTKGLRLAAVSNAGLPKPKMRLTFLPESSFTDGKTNVSASEVSDDRLVQPQSLGCGEP